MALNAWQRTIVTNTGDIIPLADIDVFYAGTNDRPDLFEDRAGNSPLSNPFNADGDGFVRFYVAAGRYDVEASGGGSSIRWEDVALGSAQEYDAATAPTEGTAAIRGDGGVLRAGKPQLNDHAIRYQEYTVVHESLLRNWVGLTSTSNQLTWACAASSTKENAVVILGNGDEVLIGQDANWLIRITGAVEDNHWRSVAWSDELSLFCAVASSGTNRITVSPDGINWTAHSAAADNSWRSIAWSPKLGLFCAVGLSGDDRIMTSPDGINWTGRGTVSDTRWFSVVWADKLELFVAVGDEGEQRIMTSPDGINWTGHTAPQQNNWYGLAWSPSLELLCSVASSGEYRAMISQDGINWDIVSSETAANEPWSSVAWSPRLEVFAAASSAFNTRWLMTSPDGINWTRQGAPITAVWNNITWADAPSFMCFVAVASSHEGENGIQAIRSF